MHRGEDPVNEALGIKLARSSNVDHFARHRFVSRGILIFGQLQFAADLFVCGRHGRDFIGAKAPDMWIGRFSQKSMDRHSIISQPRRKGARLLSSECYWAHNSMMKLVWHAPVRIST
jgi:hypothetical protein